MPNLVELNNIPRSLSAKLCPLVFEIQAENSGPVLNLISSPLCVSEKIFLFLGCRLFSLNSWDKCGSYLPLFLKYLMGISEIFAEMSCKNSKVREDYPQL